MAACFTSGAPTATGLLPLQLNPTRCTAQDAADAHACAGAQRHTHLQLLPRLRQQAGYEGGLAKPTVTNHQQLYKLAAPDLGGLGPHGAKQRQLAAGGVQSAFVMPTSSYDGGKKARVHTRQEDKQRTHTHRTKQGVFVMLWCNKGASEDMLSAALQ